MHPYPLRVHVQPPAVAQPFDICIREFERAAELLYAMDPQIVSVGITKMSGGHGLRVVRCRLPGVRALRELDASTLVRGLRGLPIDLHEVATPLRPLLEIKASSTGPGASQTMVPEQGRHRPLYAGLQLQNYDCDLRLGLVADGRMEVGSLGVLIERRAETLLLSNNHVLAGQNQGQFGDRITQAGGLKLDPDGVIARLERYTTLEPSPARAHPRFGNVIWNRVDAACARLRPGIDWRPGFLPRHKLPAIQRMAVPGIGDRVFKVGRTTGLRRGTIMSVNDRIGPVSYALGECWFSGSFSVESHDGRPFSEPGDSGAAIVRSNGELLGLIYAGNGTQTYACPITEVMRALEL